MYRIDSRGATGDGRFTEGNPTTGTPATVVNAAWMNSIQDELVNVVQGAGLTLAKTDNDQLLEAITIIARAQTRALYPVGSLYMNASDERNPSLILGFGSWTQVQGRFIVGQQPSDPSFGTAGSTGGNRAHNHGGAVAGTALTIEQIPNHSHAQNGSADGGGQFGFVMDSNNSAFNPPTNVQTSAAGGGQAHNHSIEESSHLPPFFVAFIWRRTA